MIDTQNISYVKSIIVEHGPLYGLLILLFIISLSSLLLFFNYRLKNISEEISNKSFALFKSKLDLLFRDEQLRSNYMSHVWMKAFETQLSFYDKMANLYIKYNESLFFDLYNGEAKWNDLVNELMSFRNEVFRNSVLLGPISANYIECAIAMSIGIATKKSELETNNQSIHDSENSHSYSIKCSEYLKVIEKWISDNIIINPNIKNIELSPELRNKLKEEQEKLFSDIIKNN
jgi:hypothetical protein